MAPEQNRWLSAEEIAGHLGVSIDTIYRWIAGRSMPAHKVGRLWKFKTDEVDEWVKAGGAADPKVTKTSGDGDP
jgi:excisionase family DNA binding protein